MIIAKKERFDTFLKEKIKFEYISFIIFAGSAVKIRSFHCYSRNLNKEQCEYDGFVDPSRLLLLTQAFQEGRTMCERPINEQFREIYE